MTARTDRDKGKGKEEEKLKTRDVNSTHVTHGSTAAGPSQASSSRLGTHVRENEATGEFFSYGSWDDAAIDLFFS